jgi:hypothetical protein
MKTTEMFSDSEYQVHGHDMNKIGNLLTKIRYPDYRGI